MTVIQILSVGLTFAIALIFSLLSFSGQDHEVHFKFIGSLCWFIFAFVFFIVGQDSSSVLTYALSFFWLGLGLTFAILGFADFFNARKEKRMDFDRY